MAKPVDNMTNAPSAFAADGGILDAVDRALAGVSRAMAWTAAVALLIVTALITYSVVMRYLFSDAPPWTDEMSGYLLLVIAMLGAMETMRRRDHVAVDILTSKLRGKVALAAELFGLALVVGVSAIMSLGSIHAVTFSRMIDKLSNGYLEAPLWIPQLALVVGFLGLAVLSLNRMLRLVAGREKAPGADNPQPSHIRALEELE